ncbi:hypothetical protein THAOC_19379, partial [Thalassiosira oceanica]
CRAALLPAGPGPAPLLNWGALPTRNKRTVCYSGDPSPAYPRPLANPTGLFILRTSHPSDENFRLRDFPTMTAVTPRLSQRPVSRTPNKDEVEEPFWPLFLKRANVSAAILPLCLKSVVIATLSLYLLNQKHLLPKHLSQVVSKVVDDTVLIGGVPYLGYPEKLAKENVRGVVNLCDEYRGPTGAYERLGIEQLYLPTVDHFEPEVESLKSAVSFIQEHESKGNKVSSDVVVSLCALQGWARPVCGGSYGLASL